MPDKNSTEPTVWQRLAPIQRRTGQRIQLKPYEAVLDVIDDEKAPRVVIKCVSLTERSNGFQVNKTGTRLIGFIKTDGVWKRHEFTTWDDEPDIDFCRTLGASITIFVKRERDNWAHLCYRPGTDSFPLDNSDRTFLGIEHAPTKMIKHWS